MEQKQFLEIGKITNVHGLQGEVKVIPWCDSAAFLCSFDTLYLEGGARPVQVLRAREQQNMVIMALEGCRTREQAEAMRGQVLYMNRDEVELEEGCYFVQDLVGLRVVDADNGRVYGCIREVMQTGANDVYAVYDSEKKKEYLIPAIPQVVLETDLAAGVMTIRPLEGLFDNAD
jgi:16S rRNA processing protein RimM